MALLEVNNLSTSFFSEKGEIKAVRNVSFNLDSGKVLGIVGESGSGKSVTAYSIMGLLPPSARVVSGSVRLMGEELIGAPEDFMRKIRGNRISMIFQDPMTSLNPTYTVGKQLTEAILIHNDTTKRSARTRATEILRMVNISDTERRMKQYPFELSGGMRQRVMIAMALATEPDILIADEPTTALDVTIQASILDLMLSLQKKLGMSIIMITHDLGVIAKMCDEVIVMYAGEIAEKGSATDIFYDPRHEYTKGLLRSVPKAENVKQRLSAIPGNVINLREIPEGCPFAERCGEAMNICAVKNADEVKISEGHTARCWMNQKKEYLRSNGEGHRE
ncbi:MAG: ABC transporter ATP-binding protein [Ruminococcaceae bacterium]|nr:ABC transporter ATP-binding protein [Oscillospiraceae bacterium]